MILLTAIQGMTILETYDAVFAAIKSGQKINIEIHFTKKLGGTLPIYEDDIVMDDAITMTTVLNPDNDISFGNVVSTEIKFRVYNQRAKIDTIDWDKSIKVYFYINVNGTNVYGMLGTFFGNEPKKLTIDNVDIFEFVGYDVISTLDKNADDFIESLTFPTTSQNILDEYALYVANVLQIEAIGLNLNIQINNNPFIKGMTYREVLSIIAEFCGSNVFAYNTTLKFGMYRVPQVGNPAQSVIYTLTPDEYFSIAVSELSIDTVPAVQFIDTQNETNNESYPSTYTGIPYKIVNNPIFNCISASDKTTALSEIRNYALKFKDASYPNAIEYRPISVTAIGNPIIQVGDIIYVENLDGTTYPMRVFARTFRWGSGCEDYYECTGSQQRQDVSESEKEQYYLDGRYVGRNELGNSAECDVYNALDQTSDGYVLDARQGKELDDNKADKVSGATNGNFAGLNSSGNLTDSGKKASDFKTKQTAKSDPTASGTAVQFIDTLSQNANGVITATKKTVRTFVKSGSGAASGLVPAPSTTAGTTKFLREDATWQVALTQHQDISGKKNVQTAVSDPSASGNGITFIATISQNAQGVISPTKQTVRSASTSQSGVVTTGEQSFAGKKTFTGAVYQKGGFRNMNSTTSPNMGFSGSDLGSANAIIYAIDSEESGNKYGNVYFQFYQYSPSSDGSSRTDYSDRYRFPAVASGKTANNTYNILAAFKNAPSFTSFSISANSNRTFNIPNSYRGMFYLIGTNATAQEQVMVYSTSGGSIAYTEFTDNSLHTNVFTFTKGTGTLKIANGSSYTVYVHIMSFTGGTPT